MRDCVQQHIGSPRKWALTPPVICPALMSSRKRNETLVHGRSRKPSIYCLRTKLNKHSLTTVLNRRKPRRIECNLCAFDVGLVFAVDIWCHGFEASEAD